VTGRDGGREAGKHLVKGGRDGPGCRENAQLTTGSGTGRRP